MIGENLCYSAAYPIPLLKERPDIVQENWYKSYNAPAPHVSRHRQTSAMTVTPVKHIVLYIYNVVFPAKTCFCTILHTLVHCEHDFYLKISAVTSDVSWPDVSFVVADADAVDGLDFAV